MNTSLRSAVLLFWLAVSGSTFAADHFVRPGATGANTGADWTNAWTALPARLVRGDTYWLAGGNHGAHTFEDSPNGTLAITLVRATATDHGTSKGWDASYANGPAVFTHWDIHADRYVFDGRRRNADWATGGTSQYGIRVSGTRPVRLDDGLGRGGNRLTFRFVDFAGGGRDTGTGDDVIYGLTGNSDLTFQNCALHDSDRTIFLMRGNWQRLVVDHSYIARNTSTPAVHGEMLSMTDSTDVTWSNNVMEDIEGTAFIAGLNNGTAAHWRIFGNVATHTAAYRAGTGRAAGHNWGVSGFVYIGHDASNLNVGNDIQVVNNTFANVVGTWSGVVILQGSGNVVRNNVWWQSVETGTTLGTGGSLGYNWYYKTSPDDDASTTKVVCTTSCDIFMDPARRDWHLRRPLPPGTAFPSPIAIDGDGVTRGLGAGWDRGAYQFPGDTLSPASRPSGLIVR